MISKRPQVKRNVDELCELPPEVGFAAAYNTGTEARTCFNKRADYLESEQCTSCQHHGISRFELRNAYWTSKAFQENRSHLPLCVYEFNSGVMVVKPFSRHEFRTKVRLHLSALTRPYWPLDYPPAYPILTIHPQLPTRPPAPGIHEVLDPTLCGRVRSSDKADQGALNHLVQANHIYGEGGFLRLNQSYNAITRVRFSRYGVWHQWNGALLHHTNSPKPWRERREFIRRNRTVREGFDDLTKQYRAACPIALNISGIPTNAGVGR